MSFLLLCLAACTRFPPFVTSMVHAMFCLFGSGRKWWKHCQEVARLVWASVGALTTNAFFRRLQSVVVVRQMSCVPGQPLSVHACVAGYCAIVHSLVIYGVCGLHCGGLCGKLLAWAPAVRCCYFGLLGNLKTSKGIWKIGKLIKCATCLNQNLIDFIEKMYRNL